MSFNPVASDLDSEILEQALHAQVVNRCRRALLHEIRNGLQPLHAGLEAISRAVAMTPFPAEKVQRYLQLVRQASASQEIALERAVERIAPEEVARQSVDLASLLREVTRFLNSDAAVAGVRMQLDAPPAAFALGRPHQLRLIALCLTTDAIDHTGADGQLSIAIHALDGRVLLQFSDTRAQSQPAANEALQLHVIRKLVADMQGEVDCMHTEGAAYIVAITLPAATEVSA